MLHDKMLELHDNRLIKHQQFDSFWLVKCNHISIVVY